MIELIGHPQTSSQNNNGVTTRYQISNDDYGRFRDLVQAYSGLSFSAKKRTDLEIGLHKALEDAPDGISTLDAYYNFLKQLPTPQTQAEMDRLISLLTIGETHFFRDSTQFDALANQVLPALIAQKRVEAAAVGSNPPVVPQLRLWSAGCATGEEPYSLAILLRELIPDIDQWRILILATDINRDYIARAQQAIYSDWSFREMRAKAKRHRYFKPKGSRYQLRDEIRQMVSFDYHNLIENDFLTVHNHPMAIDLIFCRNVTIYFSEDTTYRLIKKFYQALVNGGWLVVGHSEPSLVAYGDFQTRIFSNAILYQKTRWSTPRPDNWAWAEATQSSPRAPKQASDLTAPPDLVRRPNLATRRLPDLLPPSPAADKALTLLASTETKAYETAQLFFNQGELDQAIALLENNMAEIPGTDHVSACCLLARAYANQGQWVQARQWGQKVIDLDALRPEAYYILALVDEHQGQIRQAISNLNKVIYLDRMRPLPHFNLAMLHRKAQQFTHARRAFNNLIRILVRWPPEDIIPDSGGTSAQSLLVTARRILAELENT